MSESPQNFSSLAKAAQEVLDRTNFTGSPYLQALRGGTMSLAKFRETQLQFFFAVTFFPRPMAALVGRIPDPRQRLDILRNLVEEHGDFREAGFHHSTFLKFLESLDISPGDVDAQELWPEVRAFNSCLTAACVLDDVEVGIACMGIIEAAFADISAEIGNSVCANGWISPEQLVHYRLHAAIDHRHASEFFAVIAPAWADTGKRYLIQQGLEMGAYILDRLYRDFYTRAGQPSVIVCALSD